METVIDASQGNVTRYPDADRDMSVLADALPSGHDLSANIRNEAREQSTPESGIFGGQVGTGSASTIDGRDQKDTEVLVFVEESDIVEREIETYINESGQFSNYESRPEFSIDGRTVTIEGSRPSQLT